MSDLIYWQGPGWYYPAQSQDSDRNWFVVWSYWTPGSPDDQPEPLFGLGTPSFFGEIPEGWVVR